MPPEKPSLPERYERFTSWRIQARELLEVVELLKNAYEETRSESVIKVARHLEAMVTENEEAIWRLEDFYRQQELQDIFDNPHKYPFSVVTWVMKYGREDDEHEEESDDYGSKSTG